MPPTLSKDPFLGPYRDIAELRSKARGILGVPEGAKPDEIRRAFHALAREHHPDLTGEKGAFVRIVNAYLILTRPDPRGYSLDPPGPAAAEEPMTEEEYFLWWAKRFGP